METTEQQILSHLVKVEQMLGASLSLIRNELETIRKLLEKQQPPLNNKA